MKHVATYLDSGFYTISDRAAGALCRVLGQRLPKRGYEKFVMLGTGEQKLNAWLQRTPTSLPGRRGWKWAIGGIRADAGASMEPLGKSFSFEPAASTISV